MSFKQVSIFLPREHADIVSDLCMELEAISVSVKDAYEGTSSEELIFVEPEHANQVKLWEHSELLILFFDSYDVTTIMQQIKDITKLNFEYTISNVEDTNWVELTQNQFEPIEVNSSLYIIPSWHQLSVANATCITLDPGLAFGTGSHATTFMCLDWLSKNVKPEMDVLDYGCGSGILAICAKKLLANNVVGIDIDPQAVTSSINNANINQVDITFGLPECLKTVNINKYDIVVANILANPLRILAPTLYDLTGNKLILSGILATQIEELTAIYAQYFKVNVADIKDGWALIECSI